MAEEITLLVYWSNSKYMQSAKQVNHNSHFKSITKRFLQNVFPSPSGLVGINKVLFDHGTSCILIEYSNVDNPKKSVSMCLAVIIFSFLIELPCGAFMYYIVVDNNHLLPDLYFDNKYSFDSTLRKCGLSFKLFMMIQIAASFFFKVRIYIYALSQVYMDITRTWCFKL